MKVKTILSLLCFTITLAQAAEYRQVLADKSNIAFVYKQMNVPMEGNFKRFNAQVDFDPAKASSGKASVDIDLSSFDTGSLDADEEVRGKQWFNIAAYPHALFTSTAIKSVAPNRFDMSGKFTLKGRTRDVLVPISFREAGTNGIFEGTLVLKRADFGIGEGVWADFGTVANEVQIKFRFVTAPSTTSK